MSVTLLGFGKEYPLPRQFLPKSILLSTIFSGIYSETDSVDLNLDPSFEEAFTWIYLRLISDRPWAQNRSIPFQQFSELLQLSEYLGTEGITDELRMYIINGEVPLNILIQSYPEYQHLPALKNAAIFTVIRGNTYYNNLPYWAQEYLDFQQNREFPTDTDVLARIHPNVQQNIPLPVPDYPPGWRRTCQRDRQPVVYDAANVDTLPSWQQLAQVVVQGSSYLMTCPSQKYPFFTQKNALPCCTSRFSNYDTINLEPIRDKSGYMSDGGFMVFVDPAFRGDYVFSNDFTAIPEINAIAI